MSPTTLLKDSDPGPVRGLRKHDNLGEPHIDVNLDHPPSHTDTEPPLPVEIVTPPNDVGELGAVETSPVSEEPVAASFSQGIHPGLDNGHNSNVDSGSTVVSDATSNNPRPVRSRRPPRWQQSGDWVLD